MTGVAAAYSVMFNKAVDGAINPFYEWCTTWPDLYLAGRGPLPSANTAVGETIST